MLVNRDATCLIIEFVLFELRDLTSICLTSKSLQKITERLIEDENHLIWKQAFIQNSDSVLASYLEAMESSDLNERPSWKKLMLKLLELRQHSQISGFMRHLI